jgi:hypothetical protein
VIVFALGVSLLALGQTDEAAPAAEPATAPAEAPAPKPKPAAAPAPAPDTLKHISTSDELQREVSRIKKLSPDRAEEAMKDLVKHMPQSADAVKKMGALSDMEMPEVKNFADLPEADQAKYFAREFFSLLLAGDARRVVTLCGYPFQLEDRRLASADELFGELLKNLRSKRTDLLTLYDVEMLTPADMEKKYGKPPARLRDLQWHGQHTWIAVGNVSGHAAVAVVKLDALRWTVIGYHD